MQLSLSNIECRPKYEKPSEDECWINAPEFPLKIFGHIFSYLGSSGLSIDLVCSNWNQRLVTVEEDKFLLLNKFIKSCEGSLSQQRVALDGDIDAMKLVDIVKLRHSAHKIKQAIAKELMTLPEKVLNELEIKLQPLIQSTFLENIFSLSRYSEELDYVLKWGDDFYYCYRDLSEFLELDQLVELIRLKAPWVHLKYLARSGDFSKVLNILKTIQGQYRRKSYISKLINILVNQNNWQISLAIPSITKFEPCIATYSRLILKLCAQEKIDTALEIINTTVKKDLNPTFKLSAFQQLFKEEKLQNIIKKINLSNLKADKDQFYSEFALTLLEQGEFDEAHMIIEDFIDDYSLMTQIRTQAVLGKIKNQMACCDSPTLLKSLELINGPDRVPAIDLVVSKWMENGEFDKIDKFINEISKKLFNQLIERLLAESNVAKALELEHIVSDDSLKGLIYGKVAIDFIKKGKVDEAHEIFLTLTSDVVKIYTLQIVAEHYLEIGDLDRFLSIHSKITTLLTNLENPQVIKANDNFLKRSALILDDHRRYEDAIELIGLMSPDVQKSFSQLVMPRILHKLENRNNFLAQKAVAK